jgi:hypothetical protein
MPIQPVHQRVRITPNLLGRNVGSDQSRCLLIRHHRAKDDLYAHRRSPPVYHTQRNSPDTFRVNHLKPAIIVCSGGIACRWVADFVHTRDHSSHQKPVNVSVANETDPPATDPSHADQRQRTGRSRSHRSLPLDLSHAGQRDGDGSGQLAPDITPGAESSQGTQLSPLECHNGARLSDYGARAQPALTPQ